MSSESYKSEERFPLPPAPASQTASNDDAAESTEKQPVVLEDPPVILVPATPAAGPGNDAEKDGGEGGDARSMASAVSSGRTEIVPIPMAERRGLLAWLSIVPEVENPYHYSKGIKWMLTSFVAAAACAAPMGTAIFYPSLSDISEELHVTATVVNLSVAVYMLAMSIFPLWWSSFSETLGRRSIYLVSFTLNAIFTAASGVSQNIAQLIIFRILSGGAAASVQAVGAGTIADIWETRERGRAMGMFYLGPLCGPLLAPLIGGALTDGFGWRSTMYFLAVYGALIVVLVLFGVPETLPRKNQETAAPAPASPAPAAAAAPASDTSVDGEATITANNSTALSRVSTTVSSMHAHTRNFGAWLKRVLIDPLSILKLLRFPAVAMIVTYGAVTFGSLYVLNICIQSAFGSAPYNFPPLIVGILYVPGSLGYLLASLLGGLWIDRIMIREARKAERYDEQGRLIFYPEDRVRENAWVSAALYPGALIWFGWSVQTGQLWVVASIANFFFGVGSMLVFSMATTMLTEFMPKRASNGVALNNFVRNILSATGAIVGQPLIEAIGYGWLSTGLAVIAFVGGNVVLFILRRNSARWRKAMNEHME